MVYFMKFEFSWIKHRNAKTAKVSSLRSKTCFIVISVLMCYLFTLHRFCDSAITESLVLKENKYDPFNIVVFIALITALKSSYREELNRCLEFFCYHVLLLIITSIFMSYKIFFSPFFSKWGWNSISINNISLSNHLICVSPSL